MAAAAAEVSRICSMREMAVAAIDVRDALERWARWRVGGAALVSYWPDSASGGQYLSGRGSRVCPTCKGDGRMPGHLVGSQEDYISVPCPHCEGAKRVAGDLDVIVRSREIDCVFCARQDPRNGTWRSTGELADGRTCHKCHGGKRMIFTLKVHPATIKGTRYFGANEDPDPTSALIDRTVAGWLQANATFWLGRVVLAEYCASGTQESKACRMGVSRGWYCRNLGEAHRLLTDCLNRAN